MPSLNSTDDTAFHGDCGCGVVCDSRPGLRGRGAERNERHPRQTREAARGGPPRRRQGAHRGPAQARQADRARTHRAFARQGFVRGVRHVRRAPLQRIRHGEIENPRRRRRHRLGNGQRPRGLSVFQGFHRVRRLAVRDARAENHQGAGHGDEGALPDHRPVRCGRRAHPGRCGRAWRLWRGVQAQRHRVRRHSADQRHHGPLRGRRRLFAGHDRFHFHGAGHELHVRHRPGRREDRDQRGRHRRRARRRVCAYDQIGGIRRRFRERRRVPAADASVDRFPAVEQRERRAGMADAGCSRPHR